MKNTNKVFGIIALAVVIGFSMTACGGEDEDDGDGGSGQDTLTITNAQVYSMDRNENDTIRFTEFTGTVPDLIYVIEGISDGRPVLKSLNEIIDGNPTVTLTDGKLNVTLGKPKDSNLKDNYDKSMAPPGITISTDGVKVFSFQSFYNGTDPQDNITSVSHTDGQGGVIYMYSNKDVNIRGTYSTTTYAMNLKAGWNSISLIYNQTGETFQTGTPSAKFKWAFTQ